ncbi:LPXTG cell wall anchor domain-containing protein [Pediococcus acidilactici]|nr:LPXTG cell wall anchor domain-containing protein [Pediococcus acidilactici]
MLQKKYGFERKTHYKLYKRGKKWAVMAITVLSIGIGDIIVSEPKVFADVVVKNSSSSINKTVLKPSSSAYVSKASNELHTESDLKAHSSSAAADSQAKTKAVAHSSSAAADSQAKTNIGDHNFSLGHSSNKLNKTTVNANSPIHTGKIDTSTNKKSKVLLPNFAKQLPNSVTVTKDNFLNYFQLLNGATYDSKTGIITLTEDVGSKVGEAVLKNKINLNQDFTLEGKVYLGSHNGADGLGIFWHPGETTSIGGAGNGFGLNGLKDSFGFKLDTYKNPEDPSSVNGPFGSYYYTDSKGQYKSYDGKDAPAQMFGKVDGTWNPIVFNYSGQTNVLSVTLVRGNKTYEWSKDITKLTDITNFAYAFGIVGSTGSYHNLQQFQLIDFSYVAYGITHIKYVDDTTGKEIIRPNEISGDIGSTADITNNINSENNIILNLGKGYKYVKTSAKAGTLFDEKDNIITFATYPGEIIVHYTRTPAADVYVQYVSDNGNVLRKGIVNYPDGTKYVGDRYSTDKINFEGYTFKRMGSGSLAKSGILTESGGTVTYVYELNKEKATVTYIDDTTGQILHVQSLSGSYGTTDAYRTNKNIENYIKQGYSLNSDNYPVNGVVYDQDGIIKSYQVHLKHDMVQSKDIRQVNETIHYLFQNGLKVTEDYHANSVGFVRNVVTDKVTGEKTYGSWSAAQTFAAVDSPVIKGYTADQVRIGAQTVTGDSKDLEFTVVYKSNKLPVKTVQTFIPDKPVKLTKLTNPTRTVESTQPRKSTRMDQLTNSNKLVIEDSTANSTNLSKTVQPVVLTKPREVGKAAKTKFTQSKLPQTGEKKENTATLSGVILIFISSLLGVVRVWKKQRKD